MAIDVPTLVDVTQLKEEYPDFNSIAYCETIKIELDYEVKLRNNGEDFRVKVEEINGDQMVGKVLREHFYFDQPFEFLDWINFERRNVIDVYINYGLIF
jgi:hypothetical protein